MILVRENVESLYARVRNYEARKYYEDYTSISYKTQGETIGMRAGVTYTIASEKIWNLSFGLSYLYGNYRKRDIGALMTQIGVSF